MQEHNAMAEQRSYRARVKLANGAVEEVVVQASSLFNARSIFEALYGQGTITYGPVPVN
jgi:hypothetical protein